MHASDSDCAVVNGINLFYAELHKETELSNALIIPVRRKITTSYAKTEMLPHPPPAKGVSTQNYYDTATKT